MRAALITLGLVAALLFAACGDDDEDIPSGTQTPVSSGTVAPDGTANVDDTGGAVTPAPQTPPEIDVEGVTTASGLQYFETVDGTGTQPTQTSTVLVHYSGWIFPDGPLFDSSLSSGQPISFSLTQVIKGFQEGIAMMKEGGKARLIMPPEIAYGENGASGAIPPNATLIFDVELIQVQS